MAIRVERPSNVDEFLALAGSYLEAHEAEHNLIWGICSTLRTTPEVYALPPVFAVALDGARLVAAALQTPPHNLVLSEVEDRSAIAELADALAGHELPGALGPPSVVAEFVDLWLARGGGRGARRAMAERIYRCTRVIAPPPAPGGPRIAEARDRELVAGWLEAFSLEAHVRMLDDAAALAERWLRRDGGGRTLWLWEVDRRVVSLTGVGGPTPHGIRVGPVYTPPDARRRGYAGSLVAAVTQAQLDAGRRFVFLFTDLANPTSNHVYQAIGYEPVTDVDQWSFEPAARP